MSSPCTRLTDSSALGCRGACSLPVSAASSHATARTRSPKLFRTALVGGPHSRSHMRKRHLMTTLFTAPPTRSQALSGTRPHPIKHSRENPLVVRGRGVAGGLWVALATRRHQRPGPAIPPLPRPPSPSLTRPSLTHAPPLIHAQPPEWARPAGMVLVASPSLTGRLGEPRVEQSRLDGTPPPPARLAARLARARVEALEGLLGDALEHLLGEGAQQAPCNLEGVEDGAVLVRPLVDELGLELVEEFEV